ncbi:uncharacterized protein LOC105197515 isoform X2 [Solenopsis invicta]|uniref:uncharacterized protein LOC105197515 isoform X2 n=1 Tax=Solenopsis invicta TaxID=13686 RepID=UPI00059589C2|nr:uncharacterized protein LOC105197515 isoform X2 [Solenopsis invicta]
MIHLALGEEDAWCYWVVSVGALLSFLGLVAACICSCRRNENKTTSANRSLPDIPKDKNREHEVDSVPQDIYEASEIIGEFHSELYATVQDAAQEQMPERKTEIILQGCSLPQDTSHQYTRFATSVSDNVEHPYAQLQNVQKTETSQITRNNINQVAIVEKPSTSINQSNGSPIAPPRTRRSSSHNSLLNSETHYDIQAANAISGGVQANQDLPYMTPPLLTLLPHPQHNNPQQHFSGDSQDSKGYTSISVREPLANIIAQTKATYRQNQSVRPITDPHYATVSDDSDEMYAAIDEQDKVYTSGSETYAQIQPMASEAHRQAQREQTAFCQLLRTEEMHSAPQPPSVDSLRHVAHAHSRQASSSSATSSIINLGSPKPEKRQANSPLPPPPEATAEGYASIDKKSKSDDKGLRSSLSPGKSLEDMYAKVIKKKREIEEQQNDTHPSSSNGLHSETNTKKLSLIEISRASWCSHESVEIQKKELDVVHYSITGNSTINNFNEESNNSTSIRMPKIDIDVTLSRSEFDHEYEAVNSSNIQGNSIARVVANLSNPNYESLRSQCSQENDYQSNSISVKSNADVYSMPFKHRQVSNASSDDPGYEKVRLRRRDELNQDMDSEPNYESMPHDTNEPNYASVCRLGDSDTDPNYESVNHVDPNYESVKYMSVPQNEEPPYEQVNNFSLDANADGYEKVKSKNKMDVDYEKVKLDNFVEKISNGGDTDDEQYIQV